MNKAIFVAIPTLVVLSCHGPARQNNTQSVNVSIAPQKFLIDRISEGKYNVNVVVKAGQNHETYEPTPQQMVQLEQAGLYLMLCKDGFDQIWAQNIQQRNPAMEVVDLSEGVPLLETHYECGDHDHGHHHHASDPHLWISPSTMKELAGNTYLALVRYFPNDSIALTKGYGHLKADIDHMDSLYRASLQPLPHRAFMIYHPVMGYVARDYGLQQLPIEIEGKEPSVNDIKQLIANARGQNAKVIFIQQEYDTRNAQLIADETGLAIETIHPMNEDWLTETQLTLNKLIQALK
ncbi:MAG: zinc ABC transporter substrate-binding protein [Breznakibacter sp.]